MDFGPNSLGELWENVVVVLAMPTFIPLGLLLAKDRIDEKEALGFGNLVACLPQGTKRCYRRTMRGVTSRQHNAHWLHHAVASLLMAVPFGAITAAGQLVRGSWAAAVVSAAISLVAFVSYRYSRQRIIEVDFKVYSSTVQFFTFMIPIALYETMLVGFAIVVWMASCGVFYYNILRG